MVNRFLTYLSVERHYSPRTVATYHDALRDFTLFLGMKDISELQPRQVKEDDVKTWLLHLVESGNSPRTVKLKMSALHSFYKFLLRMGTVGKDVTKKIVLPKVDKPLPVFFKPQEMEAVKQNLAECKPGDPDPLIISLLYQTGIRLAEITELKDSDISFERHEIRVFGKRSKERVVPIGPGLEEEIRTYQAARGESDGRLLPLKRDHIYRIVRKRMGEVSTLKKHSTHVLRHTFATTMLNNGADIRTIQSLLGHASLATTQVYTHTTFEQVRNVYENAHPRAHGRNESGNDGGNDNGNGKDNE